ncbi:hypothetical protein BWQ96_07881 [Gracilariopsis chorda]|uniref:Uncharacterized protein n=1 Tax=Gracilariopsis chorda TaxID=448386 RepID=A0A2V3IJW6_9FLOR|nr:hypothetical protein BWQ96_07881 [Gracilariopsis chorda]|eukprot:PXF42361.1 hypothetical protein BWQ96_07881 [Gracilariopsis chorda]
MRCVSFVAALLAVWQLAHARSGINPCHDNKAKQGAGVTCQKVVFPEGLCRACKLKPFNPNNGQFYDCTSIYNLTDPQCQQELRLYARWQAHCDPVRLRQTADFSNPSNVRALDYFVYSVCEECCDCVPIGSKTAEYGWRAPTNNLLASKRGNCPAHAYFDICKVLPKIRFSKNINGQDHWDWPMICPLLTKWLFSKNSQNWLKKSYVYMDWRINRFLVWFFWDNRCGNEVTWKNCVNLESAQKRV